MDKGELAQSRIDQVTRAVKFRNGIVHKSGHLPGGVGEEIIRESVSAVLGLASRLAAKRDHLRLAPSLQKLAEETAAELGVRVPTLNALLRHHDTAEFQLGFAGALADDEHLVKIVFTLANKLSAIDPRFDRDRHLVATFEVFLGARARWVQGNLVKLPTLQPPCQT
jgi:hypothetical protein